MDSAIAPAFQDSARIGLEVVTSPEVSDRWGEESACAGMSVGGLAHHLAAQVGYAVRLLTDEPGPEEPIPVLEHYRRATWVTAAPDDEINVSIRTRADAQATEEGPEALARQVRRDLAALPQALDRARERTPDTVHIPWQGWSLTTEEFLLTRMMEILVHTDDLAVSVGLPTPDFPDEAVHRVLGLLSAVATLRHGQLPVLRALARPQRAPSSVAAF